MESRLQTIYDNSPVWVQNLLLSAYSVKLDRERYGGRFGEYQKFLEKSQWYSADQLRAYQEDRLKALIAYSFDHVPYYRRIMDERGLKPSDVQGINDLLKLPVLTKSMIRENFSELLSDEFNPATVKRGHTSGTTGSPLEICYSDNLVYINYAMMDRQYQWAGARLKRSGDRIAVVRGNLIVPLSRKKPPYWRYNYYHNQLLLSAFHISPATLKYYFEELRRFKPRIIDGYPSTIYTLAMYLQETGQTMKVDAVITSSETLYDFQREVIEKCFRCRIFDYYAAAERVLFSTECDSHQGHHIADEYGITEVLDSDFKPVSSGQSGYIVATSLHNYAMPLIRYQTNDMSAIRTGKCACGRELSLMDDVTTKAEDILKLKDGRLVSPSVLTHPFKPLTCILESQIVQEGFEDICIRLVVAQGFSDHDRDSLIQGFKQRLGANMRIRIEQVDKLERSQSGKFKWVISRVGMDI